MEAEIKGNFLATLTGKSCLGYCSQQFHLFSASCLFKGFQLKFCSGEMNNRVFYTWKIEWVDGHNLMSFPYFSSRNLFPVMCFKKNTWNGVRLQYRQLCKDWAKLVFHQSVEGGAKKGVAGSEGYQLSSKMWDVKPNKPCVHLLGNLYFVSRGK